MSPDTINAMFEFAGAICVMRNAHRVRVDKGYAGVSIPAVVFFFSWGVWNLFYYPHLDQFWSLTSGMFLVVANACWVFELWKYGRKK